MCSCLNGFPLLYFLGSMIHSCLYLNLSGIFGWVDHVRKSWMSQSLTCSFGGSWACHGSHSWLKEQRPHGQTDLGLFPDSAVESPGQDPLLACLSLSRWGISIFIW
jgi:hypothetical protein